MTQPTPELLEKLEIGLRDMVQQRDALAAQVLRQEGAIMLLRELLREEDGDAAGVRVADNAGEE